ncbi:hypothetical protein Q9L58_010850, partial [Maublancomyces gigas]
MSSPAARTAEEVAAKVKAGTRTEPRTPSANSAAESPTVQFAAVTDRLSWKSRFCNLSNFVAIGPKLEKNPYFLDTSNSTLELAIQIEHLPKKTISDALLSKENNFDLLRLLAALLVVFSHSYPISGLASAEPIGRWTGYRDGGNFAVCVFFVISGFLVTRSLERNSVGAYLAARALRILPGLALVVVIQTFLVGLIFTTLPASDYLAHPATFDGLRSILVFDVRFALPGVFQGHPMDGVVNGSLWTLPVETGFYLLLPLLGLTTLISRQRLWVLLLVLATARLSLQFFGIDEAHPGPLVFKGARLFTALDFGLVFAMGAALWVYRDRIPLSGGLA